MQAQAYARIARLTEVQPRPLPCRVAERQETGMWNQPYLETCCRSALHRVLLCGPAGRPDGLKDGPCLARLSRLGLAQRRADGRYVPTAAGRSRHAREILKLAAE